jgi:hypothetical protein
VILGNDKYLRSIFAAAEKQVSIADSWVDGTVFDTVLDSIPHDCPLKLIYSRAVDAFEEKAKRFARQYAGFAHRRYKRLHDRYMIVDDVGYIFGPAIKDAGSNAPALMVSFGGKEKAALQVFFDDTWGKARSK